MKAHRRIFPRRIPRDTVPRSTPSQWRRPVRNAIRKRLMNPLIESAASWALNFIEDLAPQTQREITDKLADRAAALVLSTDNQIDDKAAEIFLRKLSAFTLATIQKIQHGSPTVPEREEPLTGGSV